MAQKRRSLTIWCQKYAITKVNAEKALAEACVSAIEIAAESKRGNAAALLGEAQRTLSTVLGAASNLATILENAHEDLASAGTDADDADAPTEEW